ncbi:MAG: HAD-IA family hydrolase [candidate division KSB1 bacterium]|nr:HAD-IA family hydrolase [candidate division KSB1 bacterium]MDZ7366721.1 HAD-IA family hydrolase [candidate division KSB1 bacterium]MDZ7404734.1 HAD-IA family hydrolase [candidate division KSB1 bacterium]
MPNLKYEADLLIFDLDGTLVDTRRDLANAVNHALRQMGRTEVNLETLTGYVGDGIHKLLERALGGADDDELEIARQHFRHFYFDHLADFSKPYPGMTEALEYFSATKKAVLTNKPQEFTEALLQRLEICGYFEIIIGGQTNRKLKPDPEAIFEILGQLHVVPARAIIIGDGENDILAGKAAMIKTGAATYGFRPPEKLLALQPDFVIHRALELKNFIAQHRT